MRAIAVISTTLLLISLTVGLAGCSRENQHWRSAQAADSLESYDRFLERHPDGELATQARTRIAQLTEERDWQRASTSDTVDAYRRFLAQHPNGKWSQEARIRLDNFSLEDQSPQQASSREEFTVRRIGEDGKVKDLTDHAPMGDGSSSTASNTVSVSNADRAESPVLAETAESRPTVSPAPAVTTVSDVSLPAESEPESTSSPTGSESASTSESTTASASTAESSGTSFGIQLGAFSSESKAYDEWRRLAGMFNAELGSLEPHVIPATTASGELFRLQSHVGDEQNARAICASLIEKSQGCVVVLPHR